VVFLGDNGTPANAGEGKFYDGRGKLTVFESGVRVPLIVADGAALRDALDEGDDDDDEDDEDFDVRTLLSGTVSTAPASIVDVYATVVDLLALDPGSCTPGADCARDSRSLRPVLEGGLAEPASVWTEMFAVSRDQLKGRGAVRIADTKLMVDTRTGCRDYALYDLGADRWETVDLYGDSSYAAAREALLAELEIRAVQMADTDHDWLAYDDCCIGEEVWYDGVDTDRDGASDYDADGDGFDAIAHGGEDCDDADAAVHPGAEELLDGIDADCDGAAEVAQDTAASTEDSGAPRDEDCGDDVIESSGCASAPSRGAGRTLALLALVGAIAARRPRRPQ
jgi:hypothetical protein